jgi:hypothetical protein
MRQASGRSTAAVRRRRCGGRAGRWS